VQGDLGLGFCPPAPEKKEVGGLEGCWGARWTGKGGALRRAGRRRRRGNGYENRGSGTAVQRWNGINRGTVTRKIAPPVPHNVMLAVQLVLHAIPGTVI
jgi:hypothetical protein